MLKEIHEAIQFVQSYMHGYLQNSPNMVNSEWDTEMKAVVAPYTKVSVCSSSDAVHFSPNSVGFTFPSSTDRHRITLS